MKVTAPIHVLKGKAKTLKRTQGITMTQALNQIAQMEGFTSWSLLQSKVNKFTPKTTTQLLDYLHPGDLLLIGARRGEGKTKLTLQLLLEAIREGRPCFFFTFEYTLNELLEKLEDLDSQYKQNAAFLKLDFSDGISSDYIIGKTHQRVEDGSLIAVDYLQLLDQKRTNPPLQIQIENLKAYAREKKCILIFTSQIDRAFEQKQRQKPSLKDIRLPNPLDLSLFNKSVFVQNQQIYM